MTSHTKKRLPSLRFLHRFTAFAVLLFLVLHMGNHLSGVFGFQTYDTVQRALRHFYRNPIVEPVLIFAVVFQLMLGFSLVVRILRKGRPKGFWPKLQVISGGILFFTVSEHLIALYFARYSSGLDTSFYWPLSVMDGPPFIYYFTLYYFLMIASLFAHVAAAVHFTGLETSDVARKDRLAVGILVFGLIVAAIIVAMLGQVFFDVVLPAEWIEYLRQFVPEYAQAKNELLRSLS